MDIIMADEVMKAGLVQSITSLDMERAQVSMVIEEATAQQGKAEITKEGITVVMVRHQNMVTTM